MTDVYDQAQEREERDRELALAFARDKAHRARMPLRMTCYYCADELDAPGRFCNAPCRDDFERETKARARNGTT